MVSEKWDTTHVVIIATMLLDVTLFYTMLYHVTYCMAVEVLTL